VITSLDVLSRHGAAELGLPEHAMVRCILPLPTGDVALGSDYDLTLWRAGRFMAFPFPQGARRESRRVESMAVHDGVLHIATMRSRFEWPFRGQAAGKGHPLDGAGGFDDLRAVFSDGARLLMGWRLRLVGAEGPPESIAFVTAWGRTFSGTIDGQLWEIDGEKVRDFVAMGKGRPVRHLGFAFDQLWACAAGALHRWDGETWARRDKEPYALHTDARGRLWLLAEGGLWVSEDGGWPHPVKLTLDRPWALGSTDRRLWIGCKGGVVVARLPD
jgi:hypothetical protein